jgi:dTDP-4-dehydrorhamnose reductase/dTDP-4-dehydrorhamnose 3,5-epimerase
MKVSATELDGIKVIEARVFGDDRGFFFESWNARDFEAAGFRATFVQDNHSGSRRGVLRGLHYQVEHAQGKLVRVAVGEVFDVVVDLRRSSPTFGRSFGTTLSAQNRKMLWVPPGFAHGFLTLSDHADFLYKTTDYWYPHHERTLLWNDPALGIAWPLSGTPILTAKDAAGNVARASRRLPVARLPDNSRASMGRAAILVTGADGQVGRELTRLLASSGDVVAADRKMLDLADPDAIVAAVRGVQPALIVNAGAYTAVDRAESEPEVARAVNSRAPRILAEESKRASAVLVHYSTDYVFDGKRTAPYTEDAPTAPLNVYGQTKLEGEQAIAAAGARAIVLRTSWVYGLTGKNFLLTMRKLAAERDELRIVSDQTGVPNWSRTLAASTARIVAAGLDALGERSGLYHLSCSGEASWYEFARAILGDPAKPRIVPVTTADYPTPARRPAYGVLDTSRFDSTFGFALPHWRDALAQCLASPA